MGVVNVIKLRILRLSGIIQIDLKCHHRCPDKREAERELSTKEK